MPNDGALGARRGVFVSLHAGGALRGCIGEVSPSQGLAEAVARLAVAAAREDPRFAPVTSAELPRLHLEISILGEPERLERLDPPALVIGRDGVLVRRGTAVGVLLPQVAAEHRWTPEAFLEAACRKTGLAPDAWREPDTEVLVFQAEVFGEPGKGEGGA